ncbi:MAG: MurR/RpiR family transcriptional regulator [Clostridia bacterium]|nr:MurR/RpiR family transcriptional regulator [Clostridia bacterium]
MSKSFQNRIDECYSRLSKGHKRIADYLQNNYEKAAFMTAVKLGEATNVSESTVVRFASNLGYDGYPGLQKALQETVRSRFNSIQRMKAAASRVGSSDMIDTALSADIEMIKATRESLSRENFAKSVEAINSAEKIYILGARSAASLASFAAFYMNLVYDNVVLVDTSGTGEIFDKLYRISERDVCIAFSFPRYSNQTLNALRFAAERNAAVITITDSETSPIAQYATYLLTAKSSMVSFVDSLVAPLSLINALIAEAAGEKSEQVYKNLQSLEDIWEEYRVYRVDSGEESE